MQRTMIPKSGRYRWKHFFKHAKEGDWTYLPLRLEKTARFQAGVHGSFVRTEPDLFTERVKVTIISCGESEKASIIKELFKLSTVNLRAVLKAVKQNKLL